MVLDTQPTPDAPVPAKLTNRMVGYGILFESLLGVLAVLVGWWLGIFPWPPALASVRPSAVTIGWGVVATVPLVVMLLLAERIRWAPLARLSDLVKQQILPLLSGASVGDLLALSAAAGVGEELLFRGLLQTWLAHTAAVGNVGAVLLAAVLFGMLHRITWTYAILATLVGCYLGWLLVACDTLWVPIIAHGLYDFIALIYLRRRMD